jgi:hypothetical protein
MPQVMAALLVGAGIAAGLKWVVREMSRAVEATRVAHDEMRQRDPVSTRPKDLGKLEFDAKTGVYRPARKRA